jgi:hypothetical protein
MFGKRMAFFDVTLSTRRFTNTKNEIKSTIVRWRERRR